jgi:hypothetical protein
MTLHHYHARTRKMRHHQGTLYRTPRPWARYARTTIAVALTVALGTWALAAIVHSLVDAFLLTGQTP